MVNVITSSHLAHRIIDYDCGPCTYISVLERTKEIRIRLRGGFEEASVASSPPKQPSKGYLGVLERRHYAPCEPLQSMPSFAKMTKHYGKRSAMIQTAQLILSGISIVLTMLAGLIPSRIAAKKDPVESLRSE